MPHNWLLFLGQIVAFYLLVVLAAYFLQDQMLYPAGKTSTQQARNRYARLGIAPWPKEVPCHQGYLAQVEDRKSRGTVIVFHGNAGTALDRTYYSEALNRLGFRVILAEYPGYGCRAGKHGEKSFVLDGILTVSSAAEQFGGPVFLVGESLGAGVAAAVCAEIPDLVRGIAMITPWDSLADLAQKKFWYLPARYIVKSEFDSVSNLEDYNGPKAVLLAAEDSIIPPEHALRLYDSLSQPKSLWKFEGADHNSWPWQSEEAWWEEMMGFLSVPSTRKCSTPCLDSPPEFR